MKGEKNFANNISMFLGSSGIRIELKEDEKFINNFDANDGLGFCIPFLQMTGIEDHLRKISFDYEI